MTGDMQKDIFLKSEGDGYFERNKEFMAVRKFVIGDFLKSRLKPEHKVLEIGCSDGSGILNEIYKYAGCRCYGIDPSEKAIESGKKTFPHLNLKVGTADLLPYEDEFFDLIIYGFCLYLVDRKHLTKVVYEGDRVLKDKGIIHIHDFDVKIPKVRPYKHYSGINSYKLDYASLFLAFPHFSLVEKHGINFEDVTGRTCAEFLYKCHQDAYYFEEDK